jgi:hypothetical protein
MISNQPNPWDIKNASGGIKTPAEAFSSLPFHGTHSWRSNGYVFAILGSFHS